MLKVQFWRTLQVPFVEFHKHGSSMSACIFDTVSSQLHVLYRDIS